LSVESPTEIGARVSFEAAEPYGLFIGGEERQATDSFTATDPSVGQVWACIPQANATDVDAAVRAASGAYATWRHTSPAERQARLAAVADLIEASGEEWARLLATENGRPIREAHMGDVPLSAGIFRYFAGLARDLRGDTIPVGDRDSLVYTVREPLGVIAALIPWNSPLITLANKLAPALACGNTIVVKPSELASVSVLEFARRTRDILPAGVVNVVTGLGPEAGAALVAHPDVAKISFTGGPDTAERIMAAAAANLTPSLMELGGKSSFVICPDADLDAAVADALTGIFLANGEVCFASSRILVHEDVYPEFVSRFATTAEAIVVGDALDDSTQVGPVASLSHRDRVLERVQDAVDQGAELVAGGRVPELPSPLDRGSYLRPTVLVDPQGRTSAARDEIFGPVAVIERWSDEADVVRRANSTDYGLAAGVWTTDLSRAHRFALAFDAGIVWVNTWFETPQGQPQGGTKRSGFGRELSRDTLLEYSAPKAVNVRLTTERSRLWG
jgi:acyl-CoA reductase-like NAD-dependent aldehyde dehydrogenase